jgi:hypothetical protein
MGHLSEDSCGSREGVQLLADGHEQVLSTIEQVGLRRRRDVPDVRVPEGHAGRRIVGDDVPARIAGKDQPSSSRQQSTAAATAAGAGVRAPPRDLSRLVIDRGQEVSRGSDVDLLLAAETHRASGIQVGQIED